MHRHIRAIQRQINVFAFRERNVQPLLIQPSRNSGLDSKCFVSFHPPANPVELSTLIKSLGVDAKVVQELLRHASFKTTMDGYTQALEAPKRQAQAALADLIMRTGKVGYA
jgi:hypothetical protein